MASPHVAGAAALLVSLGVTRPEAVEHTLLVYGPERRARRRSSAPAFCTPPPPLERAALTHVLVRVLRAGRADLLGVPRSAADAMRSFRPGHRGFLIPAFAAGPGLLFFAPFLLPRHHGTVDFLARPIGDWDLLVSAQIHGYLPLANALDSVRADAAAVCRFAGSRPVLRGLQRRHRRLSRLGRRVARRGVARRNAVADAVVRAERRRVRLARAASCSRRATPANSAESAAGFQGGSGAAQ